MLRSAAGRNVKGKMPSQGRTASRRDSATAPEKKKKKKKSPLGDSFKL